MAILITGCANQRRMETAPGLTVVQSAILPEPAGADLIAPVRANYIGPLDSLAVEVFNVPELTRTLTVDGGGRIVLPLVGTIDVGGLTVQQVASAIDVRLRGKYVRDPQVTVGVRPSVNQTVTVDGAVNKPGALPVTNSSTLMRMIAQSGGLTEFGKTDDVVILRTVNRQRMAGLYNLGQIRRGVYVDPPIYPHDVIIVGDSTSRRLFRDFIQVAPLLSAPIVALIQ